MRAQLIHRAIGLPRFIKRGMVIFLDASLCVLAVWVAYYLRLGEWVPFLGHLVWKPLWASSLSIAIALPVFITQGLYLSIFRYSGWPALVTIAKSILIYSIAYFCVLTAFNIPGVPRTIGVIQPLLLLIMVGLSRIFARYWLGGAYQRRLQNGALPGVLVYGAGSAGRQLVTAMNSSHEMRVVGFLDDDDRLHGQILNGQPIYSPIDLPQLVETLQINYVLLAMPSIPRAQRNEILAKMREHRVSVRTLPSLTDLAHGKVKVSDLRELDIDDLLGREPVIPSQILLRKNILGKVVMVTGAGGSIGSELCRQIITLAPSKLLLIEQSEFALYKIHQELEEKLTLSETVLVPLLASVQDNDRMQEIMSTWHPNTVYHAAAYKHVPLVEHNPVVGIKNNVLGTLRTAQAAVKSGVTDFVLISTDKAVRPTSVMGATKRLAEMILQSLAEIQNDTKLSMVRFGNVLGSSGSVVPKFRQQIRDGGPVTLTHPEVTRYFMTMSEAAQLVIQAGAMAKGGDVFVLDMGQPVKIGDLARRMVQLSGLTVKDDENPKGDIEIAVTGLRPGEKLHEELLIGKNPISTMHPRIMRAQEEFIPWADFALKLSDLERALNDNNISVILLMLQQFVAGYNPQNNIMDWVHLEKEAEELTVGIGR